MPTPTLSLYVDTAEPRNKRDRLATLVDGRHWDILKTTAHVEGITRVGMLRPLYLTPEWATTTSGAYARLKKADYMFDTPPNIFVGTAPPYPAGTPGSPDKWVEHHSPYQGNVYLQGQGVNDRAMTTAKWPKNRPFLVEWFSYNAGGTSQVQLECGWLSDKVYIAVRVWTDGKCEIWKNGNQVGEGNVFERKVTTQTLYGKQHTSQNFHHKASKGDSKQLAQQIVNLALIPYRRRELLLLSNQGGGFSFCFKDIDPNNPDPEITGANSQFFWRVPQGQATVLCAPLRFQTSGALIGDLRALRLPPGASDPAAVVTTYWDMPGYGSGAAPAVLCEPDGVTAFTADGNKTACRLRVNLSSDGESTPFVYGASAVFPSVVVSTDGAHSTNLMPYAKKIDLSVSEQDVTLKLVCHSPNAIATAGAANISVIGNRPVAATIGSVSILTGRSKNPSMKVGIDDKATEIMQEWRDLNKALEEYEIQDPVPVDGLDLGDGFRHFAKLPGFADADMDIPYFGFPLPTIGSNSEGEWNLLPQVGDRALQWIKKLWELFARHTLFGWKPTVAGPKFRVRTLDDIDASTSAGTWYQTYAAAMSAGWSRETAYRYVLNEIKPGTLEVGANDIWVSGRDPRTGLIFQSHYADKDSQKVDTIVSARPLNWVGEPRRVGFGDPAITDKQTANWVAMTLARRLCPVRFPIQWKCQFMIWPDGSPVWRGDKVTLDGYGDVRVMTLSGQFVTESAGATAAKDWIWREFTYTGELILPPGV